MAIASGATGPRNIVLFSDGTGNSSAKLFKTNVWRVYQALDIEAPGQVAIYDDGVGTSSFRPLALIGSAIGIGLARNVRELYAFVCRNYRPGDKLFGFGFSRGAFTIRIVNGLIASQGIVRNFDGERDLQRKVKWAYRAYRGKYIAFPLVPRVRDFFGRLREIRQLSYCRNENYLPYHPKDKPDGVTVEFVGLWDTVGAYGLPIEEMTRGWDRWIWPLSMRDRDLWRGVQRACHALSLDDERYTFHPVLWNEVRTDTIPDKRAENCIYQTQDCTNLIVEVISQVWFAGVHGNVGGGYPDDSLSHVPLLWIVEEARKRGLAIRRSALPELVARADPMGPIYDSRRGFALYYRYLPRKLAKLTNDRNFRRAWAWGRRINDDVVKIPRPKIHHSVFDRIASAASNYAPIGLPDEYAVVMGNGDIVAPSGVATDSDGGIDVPKARVERQERVWDKVWWRRVSYFTTLFVTLLLVAMPWLPSLWPLNLLPPVNWVVDGGKCVDSILCSEANLIKRTGTLLPGLASPWVGAYSSNPGIVAVLAVVLYVLIRLGRNLKASIADDMRRIWKPPLPHVPPSETYSRLYRFRESPPYRSILRALKQRYLPSLFGFSAFAAIAGAMLYAPIVTASRMWFSIVDARGGFCTAHPQAENADLSDFQPHTLRAPFEATELCWATGLSLEEDARYRITLQATAGPWRDGDLPADLTGIRESHNWLKAILAWPLKRHFDENYMKPIARIAHTDKSQGGEARGQDDYILDPVIPVAKDECTYTLVSELTAKSSGELFLYTNDAIFFSQSLAPTYGNNHGAAKVTVQRVNEPTGPVVLPAVTAPSCQRDK